MKDSDRYLKLVEWSHADKCYLGSAPGLIGHCCHGEDEAEVYGQLCVIVDEWIAVHRSDGLPLPSSFVGKDFSGKFVVRVGQDLHKALAIKAANSGTSLNRLCADALQESILAN